MRAGKVLKALKNTLKRDIEMLKKRVKDDEEDTFVNGSLWAKEIILQTIKNHEKMRDI